MPPTLVHTLREQVRARAENRPGVYRFYGPGDELLYVGKSVRVRSRLLSYFTAPKGEKAWGLVRDAARVDWEHVPNEFGAVLREMRLIQRHRPKYNVEHKRKRRYAFVKVTREPAARVLATTRVADDGATYFGPFPRVGRTAETIRELAYVMGLRDCAASVPMFFDDQLEIFGGGRSGTPAPGPPAPGAPAPGTSTPGATGPGTGAAVPKTARAEASGVRAAGGGSRSPGCLRADLGTCLAPCCGRTSASEYRERVDQTVRFLEGRGKAPLKILQARMAEAVHRRDFEYAGTVRDRLERIAGFQDELAAWRGRVRSLTFVYRVPGWRGADRLYLVRRGLVRGWTEHPKSAEARLRVARIVRETFDERAPDPDALTPWEAAEILLVARWFRTRKKEMKRTSEPAEWLREAR